jgi:L-arabinokinase
VVDIPGLPVEAAALAGIPSVAVGNFGWDWIYSEFVPRDARWKPIVEMFRMQYSKTSLLLRLPFCETMNAFPNVQDIPLVAAPGRPRRSEIVALTGCDPGKKWILLSFTTLDWSEETLERVERIEEYEFLTVLPLQWRRRNIHALSRGQITFSDVIASADAVISKPGFGILSDCVVNRKPLIYADRSDFLEYPILEASIQSYLRHIHIPVAKLYSGDLLGSLSAIWTRPEPAMELTAGGDRIAAERIAGFLNRNSW